MIRQPQTLLIFAALCPLAGCHWTATQQEPETFHENQSGFVDDEDGDGQHWESKEVTGARGGWDLKHND